MNKTCPGCSLEKTSSEFSKHPKTKDGLHTKCKRCCLDRAKERYWLDRKRYLEKGRLGWEKRKHSQKYKDQCREKQRRFKLLHPEIVKARRAVEYALRVGKIFKGVCEKCGTKDHIQAHHEDYSKPLGVRWMCFLCHRKHHGKFVKVV